MFRTFVVKERAATPAPVPTRDYAILEHPMKQINLQESLVHTETKLPETRTTNS
jgi:hypothetical protein